MEIILKMLMDHQTQGEKHETGCDGKSVAHLSVSVEKLGINGDELSQCLVISSSECDFYDFTPVGN